MNPRWHRAIRLYGLRLIEKQPQDTAGWKKLVSELFEGESHTSESDLVLESVVFAANAESQLETVWPLLKEADGALLIRLLTRFLHVATLPNPIYAKNEDQIAMATYHRVPFWPLWLPVLKVLSQNRNDAICLAPEQTTKIAELWLKYASPSWPLRKEAARILLDATKQVVTKICEEGWRADDELAKNVFSRMPIASLVLPSEVGELALALVERKEASLFASESKRFRHSESSKLAAPWPEGPWRTIQESVRQGFLSVNDPLRYLFETETDVGVDVLLALLISEPLPAGRLFGDSYDQFPYVQEQHEWRPAMYFHGPFLSMLRVAPLQAIKAIVDLANFITQRWCEHHEHDIVGVVGNIEGEDITYSGTRETYCWFRDTPCAPRVLVPALMALEKWLYMCLEKGESVRPYIQMILKRSESTALLGVLVAVGRKKPSMFLDELRALVPIWQLQVWGRYRLQMSDMVQRFTMMEWTQWGEPIFNMVKEWHELSHRKTNFSGVLLKLLIIDKADSDLLKQIQALWKSDLEKLQEGVDFEDLEKIAIELDEGNWRGQQTEHGVIYHFVEPAERTEKLAPDRDSHQKRMEVQYFPFECRQMIDAREPLKAIAIEQFWNRVVAISNSDTSDERPQNAIAGGIAVLAILHPEWLKENPSREEWCGRQLLKIAENPPPEDQLYVVYADNWRNFFGMLLPKMLSEDPENQDIRSLSANIGLAYRDTVVEDLMRFAFENRVRLGDDFYRLQRLVMVSSGFRNVKNIVHGGNSFWSAPDIAFDLTSRLSELFDQFVESSLEASVPSLVEIAQTSTSLIADMVQQQRELSEDYDDDEEIRKYREVRLKRGRGFEPLHIKSGFRWLSRIDEEDDPAVRLKWISTTEQILLAILRPLGSVNEAISDANAGSGSLDKFFNSPSQPDYWIFDFVAEIIPKLFDGEPADKLWKPILSFGLERERWVSCFLSSWFTRVLNEGNCNEQFFQQWKAMIDYAWARNNWRETEVRGNRTDHDLLHCLMGFSRFRNTHYLEGKKFRTWITKMKPEFGRWADEFFPHPRAISHYACFLVSPSAAEHFRDGVARIASATRQFEEWHWRDFYHLERSLLQLLEFDWKNSSQLIMSNPAVSIHFTSILKTLVDRQVPAALVIQDQLL